MRITITHRGASSRNGQTQRLDSDVVRIGRRPENDVRFDAHRDPLVSGDHAELCVRGERLFVADLGSTNGTFRNGTRLAANTPMEIASGDTLMCGRDGPEMLVTIEGVPTRQAFATAEPNGPAVARIPLLDAGAPSSMPRQTADRPGVAAHPGGSTSKFVGLGTLMGVLEKRRHDERRRFRWLSLPLYLLLIAGAAGTTYYLRPLPPPAQRIVVDNAPAATAPAYIPPPPEIRLKDWAEILPDVKASVYQVQAYKKNGDDVELYSSGTAWSVRPGLLATNAHVAALLDDVAPGGFLIARREDSTHDLRIVGTRIHPGYDACQRLWNDYNPFVPQNSRYMEHLTTCDVALLQVDPRDVSRQARPLPIDDTTTLRPGDRLGYAGFSAENVKMNIDQPNPDAGSGEVSKMMGLCLEEERSANDVYFVGHTLFTLGGASGSPIVNAAGYVVAVNFAGDYAGENTEGNRLAVAGHKYAIPVRLLKELLDGKADANQAARDRNWATQMRGRFENGIRDPMPLLQVQAMRGYYAVLRQVIADDPKAEPKDYKLVTQRVATCDVNQKFTQSLAAPESGVFVYACVINRPGGNVAVDFSSNGKILPVNDMSVPGGGTRRVYYGCAAFKADAGVPLRMDMTNTGAAARVTWALYEFKHK